MKKLLLATCALLLLAGCGDAHAKIKSPNDVLVKVGKTSITKGNVYETMKTQAGSYHVISLSTKAILDAEVEVTEDMKKEANATLEQLRSSYGDGFATALSNNGYLSEEDFLNNSLLLSKRLSALTDKYIKENAEDLLKQYSPKKIAYVSFSEEETAHLAQLAAKDGQSLQDVATAFKSENAGNEQLVNTTTTIDAMIQSYIKTASTNDLSEVITGTDGKFYIVKIVEADIEKFKEEAITSLSSIAELSSISEKSFYKKYNFSIFDRDTYNSIKAEYPQYLEK